MNKGRIIVGFVLFVIFIVGSMYLITDYLNIYYAEQQETESVNQFLMKEYKELEYDVSSKNVSTDYSNNSKSFKSTNISNDLETDIHIDDNQGRNNKIIEDMEENDDADSILIIPSINLKKYVYTGKQRAAHLEQYELVTATDDMRYCNGGNYIICGHYSKLYGHSLNRLKEISVSDDIIIWNDNKIINYKVSSVSYVNMNNTNQYCDQDKEKQITIVSCAKYEGDNKYIVVKCECTD